jgi:hypothetical protein
MSLLVEENGMALEPRRGVNGQCLEEEVKSLRICGWHVF